MEPSVGVAARRARSKIGRLTPGTSGPPAARHMTGMAAKLVPHRRVTPALAGSRARNTKPSPFAATSKAEARKHSNYDGPVASMNPPLKFVAIAFNDYGAGPALASSST